MLPDKSELVLYSIWPSACSLGLKFQFIVTLLVPGLLCPPAQVSVGVKVIVGAIVSTSKSVPSPAINSTQSEYSVPLVVFLVLARQCLVPSESPEIVTPAFRSELQGVLHSPVGAIPVYKSATPSNRTDVGFTSTCKAIF